MDADAGVDGREFLRGKRDPIHRGDAALRVCDVPRIFSEYLPQTTGKRGLLQIFRQDRIMASLAEKSVPRPQDARVQKVSAMQKSAPFATPKGKAYRQLSVLSQTLRGQNITGVGISFFCVKKFENMGKFRSKHLAKPKCICYNVI